MGNRIDQVPDDCQVVHYCYDLNTHLRHAFIERDNHLIEAVKSVLPFEEVDTFYWLEDENNPDSRREDLMLDAEVKDNGRVRMEIHPGLFRHPEVIDLESVWFGIVGKGWGPGDVIRITEIGFIWVMAFLRDLSTSEIIEDKLFIHKKIHEIPPEFEQKEKKPVATAPKKRGKVRRLNVAPVDVVKEGERLELWESWLKIYRQLYRRSRCGNLEDMPHYPRKTAKKGRYYFLGGEYLGRICGLGRWTVVQVLKQLEAENLIYTRYHGFKGRGCSIIELPVNLRLVWKWRRQPGRQKPST